MGRRAIAIIIAVIVAVLGAGAVVAYAQSADQRAVAGQQITTVYIAKKAVPEGMALKTALDQGLLGPEQVVAKGVPDGAMAKVDPATSALVAQSAIAPGELILTDRFGAPKVVILAPVVPKGQIAVTVSLSDPARIAPLLKPGSHIVLYDTFNSRDPKAGTLMPDGAHLTDKADSVRATRILLPNVQVIAVGTQRQAGAGAPTPSATAGPDGKAAAPQDNTAVTALVTVAVSPDESITLVHGIQTGTLYAGLLGDGVKPDVKQSVTDNTVLGK